MSDFWIGFLVGAGVAIVAVGGLAVGVILTLAECIPRPRW